MEVVRKKCLSCNLDYCTSTMKLYHKIFKSRDDMSVYLENMDPLISYDEELLNRLTNARNTDVGNWGQTPLG